METENLTKNPLDDLTISDVDPYLDSEGKAKAHEMVIMKYSDVLQQIEHLKNMYSAEYLREKVKKENSWIRRLVRTKKFIEQKRGQV